MTTEPRVLAFYALATVTLFIKFWLLAVTQGLVRVRHKTFVNPEDARVFGRGGEAAAAEHPTVARAGAAMRNDLENLPFFFVLALVYTLLGCWPTGAPIILRCLSRRGSSTQSHI